MSELGVEASQLDLSDVRPGSGEVIPYLEWTVDGEPLRVKYSEPGALQLTMLMPDDSVDQMLRTENLLRLRGDDIPPPSFKPRYHRARLDRLLHLRGTPYAPAGTAYEDGRVGLIFCPCGDLDCGALTTRVVVTGETVTWRDIGWQVTYEPHVPYNDAQQWLGDRDLTFERAQYESVISQLLEADWSMGLPQL